MGCGGVAIFWQLNLTYNPTSIQVGGNYLSSNNSKSVSIKANHVTFNFFPYIYQLREAAKNFHRGGGGACGSSNVLFENEPPHPHYQYLKNLDAPPPHKIETKLVTIFGYVSSWLFFRKKYELRPGPSLRMF